MSLPITWVEHLYDRTVSSVGHTLAPGAAEWQRGDDGQVKRLHYVCPCGCGDWRSVSVVRGSFAKSCWGWDGNEILPTLTPSIQHVKAGDRRCGWHGHLLAGLWKTSPS